MINAIPNKSPVFMHVLRIVAGKILIENTVYIPDY